MVDPCNYEREVAYAYTQPIDPYGILPRRRDTFLMITCSEDTIPFNSSLISNRESTKATMSSWIL